MEHTASQCCPRVSKPNQVVYMLMMPCSQLLNEIMPLIYKRFTDKSAEEWRQIYKVRSIATQVHEVAILTSSFLANSRVFNFSNSSLRMVRSGWSTMHDLTCRCCGCCGNSTTLT
jgi:CBS domain containing-hemolysin-like protein